MYRDGLLSGGVNRILTGTAGNVFQTAIGMGEGFTLKGSDIEAHRTGHIARFLGRGVGLGANVAGQLVESVGAPAAVKLGKAAIHDAGVLAGAGGNVLEKASKGALNLLTKKAESNINNLFTGREFRRGAVMVGELLPLGIVVGSAMMAARQANMYGTVYGNPDKPEEIPSMGYDGLNATGDLTLALHKNRRG